MIKKSDGSTYDDDVEESKQILCPLTMYTNKKRYVSNVNHFGCQCCNTIRRAFCGGELRRLQNETG